MNETIKNSNGFVGYEHQNITVKNKDTEKLYIDNYKNFGWIFEGYEPSIQNVMTTTLKFKRDRKITNKTELTRLQRQFDSCVKVIEKLEFSKAFNASAIAYGIGVVGAGFTVGTVFAFLGSLTVLGVVLAIPALVGWVLPYLLYNRVLKNKTEKNTPLIEQQYDEIYEACEKGNSLIYA